MVVKLQQVKKGHQDNCDLNSSKSMGTQHQMYVKIKQVNGDTITNVMKSQAS